MLVPFLLSQERPHVGEGAKTQERYFSHQTATEAHTPAAKWPTTPGRARGGLGVDRGARLRLPRLELALLVGPPLDHQRGGLGHLAPRSGQIRERL